MNLPVEQRREWIRSRREQRKLMRLARLRRQILRYVLLALLLCAAGSSFYYMPWSLGSLASAKHSIIVKGNHVVTDDQVRHVLEPDLTSPLYQLDPQYLQARLENMSMVRHAFVRRYCLPHPRLVVEILEEFPWASYAADPDSLTNWVIAESGRTISVTEFPQVLQPPLKFYGPASLHLTSHQVGQWASWIAQIEKISARKVETVDLRLPQNVLVQAGDLSLHLGSTDASLNRRLLRLASVLTVTARWQDKLEYIDLGLDSNIPVKVAKKMSAAQSAGQKYSSSQPPRSQL